MACKLSPKGWSSVNLASSTTHQIRLCFPSFPTEQSKRPYSQPLLRIDHWCSISSTILVSSSGHFHKRRKGGYCTMNQATQFFLAVASAMLSAKGILRAVVFSFFPNAWFLASRPSYIWPCNLVFQHGIKAGGRWEDHMVVSPELISH